MISFRKILVPVDFSRHSAKAVEVGLQLAKRFEARLGVVHVYQPFMDSFPGGFMLPPATVEKAWPIVREGLEKLLQDVRVKARDAGVPEVETHLVEGVPHAEIARVARDGNYDLIVIGTHGRTGISHALLGSVAERVVRMAPCAVLTVRLTEQEAGEA
jgi:nucleotide-binding universal stress UspA family protein